MNHDRAGPVEFSKVGDTLRQPLALGLAMGRPRWWRGFIRLAHRKYRLGLNRFCGVMNIKNVNRNVGRLRAGLLWPVTRACVHAAARVRLGRLSLGVLLAALLTACGTPPPPPQLYQLRSAPPVTVQALATAPTVQLLGPVAVPELLERDAIVVAQGQAGVQALSGHRSLAKKMPC